MTYNIIAVCLVYSVKAICYCILQVSSNMDLVCATDQMLFFPIVNGVGGREWGKFKPLPTKHCFVMKVIMCTNEYHR